MQVQCDKCERDYHVSCRFGQERLWRITCPHCGGGMWVSAPVSDARPTKAGSHALPGFLRLAPR